MQHVHLALAILFEVGWALSMKLSQGLTRPLPTVLTLVSYLLSLVFLSLAARRIELGVVYALWAGTGAALIALAGIVWFRESVTPLRLLSLGLVIAGLAGLHLSHPRS